MKSSYRLVVKEAASSCRVFCFLYKARQQYASVNSDSLWGTKIAYVYELFVLFRRRGWAEKHLCFFEGRFVVSTYRGNPWHALCRVIVFLLVTKKIGCFMQDGCLNLGLGRHKKCGSHPNIVRYTGVNITNSHF